MKSFDIQTLIKKSLKELVAMRNDLKKQIFDMRVKLSLRTLQQTHLVKIARRNIARVNTAI